MLLEDWTVHDIRGYCSCNSNNIFAFSLSSQIPSISTKSSLNSLPFSFKHIVGVSHKGNFIYATFIQTHPCLDIWVSTFLPGSEERDFWPDVWRSHPLFILDYTTMVIPPAQSKSALLSHTLISLPSNKSKQCFILPCAFFYLLHYQPLYSFPSFTILYVTLPTSCLPLGSNYDYNNGNVSHSYSIQFTKYFYHSFWISQ